MSHIDHKSAVPTTPGPRAAAWTLCGVLLIVLSVTPLALAASTPAKNASSLAAVFAPWADQHSIMTAVAAADATLLRGGGWGNVIVVRSTDDGLAGRLRAAGAWLVLDPLMASGCFTPENTPN